MAFTPWNMLINGRLRTDAEEQQREQSGQKGRQGFAPSWKRSENERKISEVLEKTAKELGTKNIRAGVFQKSPCLAVC